MQVLDEVERRRALSPALVQPFMRAIMEAQFPAPGKTITIKTFLPGSGTEVTRGVKGSPDILHNSHNQHINPISENVPENLPVSMYSLLVYNHSPLEQCKDKCIHPNILFLYFSV